MRPISLFGSGVVSYSQVVTAQRRLNCFYDLRPDGDKWQMCVRGTPGTTLISVLGTATVRGWWAVGTTLYVVAGAALYSLTTGFVATSLGTVTTSSGNVGMADNGLEVIIVDGTGGYIITIATGVVTTITDANFPNGATTVAFINGRFLVDTGSGRKWYVSQSYAGTNWTPAIFATKENRSDALKAVQVWNGNVINWGANSMEFWQDVGAAPVPYQRINGATQTWGLAAVWSRAECDNTVMFLGQNPQGTIQVMRINGYEPLRISTSDIENIINKWTVDGTGVTDAVALSYMVDGHAMYQLTFPAGGRSFLYDALSKIWYEVQTGLTISARHYANLGIVFNGLNYVSDYSNGSIYQIDPTVLTDNGGPIKRQTVSRHIQNGGEPFSIDEVYLDMETGVGLQTGQGSAPQIMMQVSKDGGRTFGIERWVSIGKVGQYFSPRVIWRRVGQAKDFVFRFTMTDPVKFFIAYGAVSSQDQEAKQNGVQS